VAAADAYAEALLPLAQQAGVLADVLGELEQAAAMLDGQEDIRRWFDSPLTPIEAKAGAVERAFRGHVTDLTCDALGVIARHDRMGRLADVVYAFRRRVLDAQNKVEAHVTTAAALTDAARSALRQALRRRFGVEPVLVEHVDPDILGGLVVRVGDEVVDVSVQNELQQINQAIARWMDRMIAQPMPGLDLEAESE